MDWFKSIHLKLWMYLIHPPYFKDPLDHLFEEKKIQWII